MITLAVKHCSNARAGGWHEALQIFCQAKPLVKKTEIWERLHRLPKLQKMSIQCRNRCVGMLRVGNTMHCRRNEQKNVATSLCV